MKLETLTIKEFTNWAIKSDEITFHQTKEWADLKKRNGWKAYYVGLKDKKEIKAASLILAKEIPVIKKKMFYAPRGFLIDYHDLELLTTFTSEIKKWAKEKKGIFIKIDPYVMYKEHDLNGDLVKDGIDNSDTVDNLKSLGYHHFGFNLMQDTLQPRWMHTITVKNRSLDDVMKDMESKTRQILRKNERLGVKSREITRDEIKIFKDIMQHTGERRDFIDRPLSYYENMWDTLHDSGILKILVAEVDFDEEIKNTKDEIKKLETAIKEREEKFNNKDMPMNEKKYNANQNKDKEEIERLKKNIEKSKSMKKEYGAKPILGGILFLIYGNEVLSLFGGSKKELMSFQSAYTLHFEGIKYAVEHGYDTYNFYGITGDFSKDNPLLGLYLFKKSFGGQVVELIGEFDLIISKFWYHTYNVSFNLYHKLKKLKNHK